MTDDTTTWLKKNPSTNPLRRSLKTSLRFHVNASEMDGSIMSNTTNGKDQQIHIPRMFQRPSMRMRMMNEFKVPSIVTPRNEIKLTARLKGIPETNTNSNSKIKTAIVPRKSCLPIKSKPEIVTSETTGIIRPSFMTRNSARKNNFRREIQKMVEASQNNQGRLKVNTVTSADGSVVRSILKKKRVSLRNSGQSSDSKKSKTVKKVLFEGFGNSSILGKENESIAVSPIIKQPGCEFEMLDDPTECFNFSKTKYLESSPKVPVVDAMSQIKQENPTQVNNLNTILKNWKSYLNNMNNLQSMRITLSESIKVHMEQSLLLQNQWKSYIKSCDEIYEELDRLGKEVEQNFVQTNDEEDSSFQGVEKKTRVKTEKIRLSDRSKAIKRGTGKSYSALKAGLWLDNQDGFTLVEKKGVFCK
ncbi:hypothetical protein RUM44_012656 [Polyplax serrata]|uniref:Uncharacterized protein n=1 Tax=Polyplax serrata TaxID=468196 RepID=A0ABR1BGT8_POLSC